MKRIRINVANAVKKGLVKVGDEIMCRGIIEGIDKSHIDCIIRVSFGGFPSQLDGDDYLYIPKHIPKPEPKPIDFGKAGLVLKGEFSIIQPIAVKSRIKDSVKFVDPFTSNYAMKIIIDVLDEKLFEELKKPPF